MKTSATAKNKWTRENYDRLNFVVKKGDREKLKAAADAEGVSVGRFIVDSVNARIPGLLTPLDDTSKKKKESK